MSSASAVKTGREAWKLAATTILMDSAQRVMMLCRGATAKFMPNSFVFPGGILDPADDQFPEELTNSEAGESTRESPITLGLKNDFPFRVCAIREMFEESGFLPVSKLQGKTEMLCAGKENALQELRSDVRRESSCFAERFREYTKDSSNILNTAGLIPFSNWLTPGFGYSQRYNTIFFVLPLDMDGSELPHLVAPCEREMTSEVMWAEPAEILERSKRDEISIPPPQYYELRRMDWAMNTIGLKPKEFHHLCDPNLQAPELFPLSTVLAGDYEFPTKKTMENHLNEVFNSKGPLPMHRMFFRRTIIGEYYGYRLQIQQSGESFTPHMFHVQPSFVGTVKKHDIDDEKRKHIKTCARKIS